MKKRNIAMLVGFIFLFLTILMGLIYIAVVYADEIRYIFIEFLNGFNGDMLRV